MCVMIVVAQSVSSIIFIDLILTLPFFLPEKERNKEKQAEIYCSAEISEAIRCYVRNMN
jgi:hypothetical protein